MCPFESGLSHLAQCMCHCMCQQFIPQCFVVIHEETEAREGEWGGGREEVEEQGLSPRPHDHTPFRPIGHNFFHKKPFLTPQSP